MNDTQPPTSLGVRGAAFLLAANAGLWAASAILILVAIPVQKRAMEDVGLRLPLWSQITLDVADYFTKSHLLFSVLAIGCIATHIALLNLLRELRLNPLPSWLIASLPLLLPLGLLVVVAGGYVLNHMALDSVAQQINP